MSVATREYLQALEAHAETLAMLPFEHVARKRSFADLLARLGADRDALVMRSAEVDKAPAIVIVAPAEASCVEQAGFSAFLQSHPSVTLALVGKSLSRERLDRLLEAAPKRPDGLRVHHCVDPEPVPEWIDDADYVIPFGAGDVLHPALATTLSLLATAGDAPAPQVWSWNATTYAVSGTASVATGFVRKPARPDLSWLSGDVVGRGFAIRGESLRKVFPQGLGALCADGLALRILRLATSGVTWRHHPEYLGLYRADTPEDLVAPHRPDADTSRDLHRYAAWSLPGVDLEPAPATPGAAGVRKPALQPVSAGDGISVIIPFRDKADLTLKAVASVAAQSASTWIELVLVDNQSQPSELTRLREGLDRLGRDGLRVQLIGHPHPFNHSRQCNLGARVAVGETLVFLNNDAVVDTADALDSFARWSGAPGVATVGPRISTPSGEQQCAGLRARQNPGCDYNSPLEENRDATFSAALREVPGSSFACAAIRRSRFFELGWLDEVLFPIGYNDIDFCLRASAREYRHLALGWLSVTHRPGSSRGTSDEILQKVLIRDRFSQTLRLSQYQLEADMQLLRMSNAASANAPVAVRPTPATR